LTTHDTRYYHEADHIVHLKGGKIEELKAELTLAEPELDQQNATPDGGDHDVWGDPSGPGEAETLNLEEEERETGRVALKVYMEYFLYGASAIVWFIIALLFFSGQGKEILIQLNLVYGQPVFLDKFSLTSFHLTIKFS
jgi:hypothetical protein